MRFFLNALLLAGALLCGAPAAQAASEHENDIHFGIAGVQYFSFSETGHSITSGQPYGGAYGRVLSGLYSAEVIVKAGRKGSSGPVEWFKTQIGDGAVIGSRSSKSLPKDLNFAVEGTMTIRTGDRNVICDGIIVAQGHHGAFNDWWLGGPYMKAVDLSGKSATTQTCRIDGSLTPMVAIFSYNSGSSWFTIGLAPL
jgi:hypothetical protein